MKLSCSVRRLVVWQLATIVVVFATSWKLDAQEQEIPEALKPWESWVTWDAEHQECPTTYSSAEEHICFWPSRLAVVADQQSGTWDITVTVFAPTWVPLPGNGDVWPVNVRANGEPIVVVERGGIPSVQLASGRHELSGEFKWDEMPQRVAIPPQIGIMSLSVAGESVPIPTWDANGQVWLKRIRAEQAEKDLLGVHVYRVLQDGIPTWLTTEIEITVSGKSREEDLGWTLPAGFKLSTVDSPLPVAVDDVGRMKAQVRAGKWTISTHAFRVTKTTGIQFADGSEPITNRELVGFQSQPELRLAEIEGLETIDVTQTTYPEKWRHLPVYRWDTSSAFQLTEKMRGMGLQRPEGLSISRRFWLDEDGEYLTYQDRVSGRMQQRWRLDVADGHELGAVRVDEKRQLITSNPQNESHGVELRTRNLNMEAIGRVSRGAGLPATGWQTDADSLDVTFTLPPGWRVFALFGADIVQGDWLSAWLLLDVFLLLIFSLAVFRIWGFKAGVVAFLAFGLAYHEPGAPRLTWLFLLLPVALLTVVPEGIARKCITIWKGVAVAFLVINLVPFVARQIQTAIYPQLETPGINYSSRGMFRRVGSAYQTGSRVADMAYETVELESDLAKSVRKSRFQTSNLLYDSNARIQTGPAEPRWNWNTVHCSWDGPVAADQTIRPILISMSAHRVLTVVRVLLLTMLGAIMIGTRRFSLPSPKPAVVAAAVMLACFLPDHSVAQEFPDQNMLDTLRARLLESADVYPRAAEITAVNLSLDGNRVKMEAEIHSAIEVAVPLPGQLSDWSPISAAIDDQPAELVCRRDGYLWIVMPKGVHKVVVESLLLDAADWEWTFLLKPRRVSVAAPGWNVTGIGANGVPEQQVFFSRQQPATDGVAAYDRKDFNAIVAVDRHIEIGLVWQLRTVVSRLASAGKAVSLKVPLLPQESVLSSNVTVDDAQVDVRLGVGQDKFSWNSEIPVDSEIQLNTRDDDSWIERWHLVTSPVWNMTQSGLSPVFEAQQENMIPVWHPWPSEAVTLSFNKSQPVSGDIMTVQQVDHSLTLGRRQRTTQLKLIVECSIGSDFILDIAPEADITSLNREGQAIPVRRANGKLIIPVHPGRQSVEVTWVNMDAMETVVDTGRVKLPVEGSNATTVLHVPESRWVLWADGPLRGPAVRFWTILLSAILIALVLGGLTNSPLSRLEWVLLAIGLTQVHVAAALIVVAWLFLLAYRGKQDPAVQRRWLFNFSQIAILCITFVALCIFVVIVSAGLLGHPEMFILGNNSSRTVLNWFQPRTGQDLPVGRIVSVSVWFYQLLMLCWALWLAASLLRWLQWGWTQFSAGACWMRKSKVVSAEAV